MTAPARRGSGYDRVGGSRLTGLGTLLLAVALVSGTSLPPTADRQILVIVWAGLLAVAIVGIVWPMVLVRRITVAATAPTDATVGDRPGVVVTLGGRAASVEVRALDPTGGWHRAAAPGTGTLVHLADRRGVFDIVRVEVRITAPVGVLAAHRVHEVRLPHPIAVAPRPLAVSWLPAPAPIEGASDRSATAVLGGDLVRAVRPYVPGDPAHLVHWPSTARSGSMVVREMEPPTPMGQAIVVDLRDLGDETEPAAAYAFGAACAVLAAGGQLTLCTAEAAGPATGPVRSRLEAGRRLAAAVPGVPGAPPEGWPIVEIGR